MEERELFRGQLGGGVKVRTNHSCATLDSFPFKWQRPGSATNEALTANKIDDLLGASTNLTERFGTAHHEMGHVFYQLSYDQPGVPMVLRTGASPAFHEAMAETLATPTIQLRYLRQVGVVPADMEFDQTQWLLNAALQQIVFIPWSAGVMAAWECDFYEGNLPTNELNHRWWQYVARYQGIAPQEPRGEQFCDAATKTHINDNPALYLREATGEELNAKAMLEYYSPLIKYLQEENAGREIGFPAEP